jgi:hypothetical protein
MVGKNINARTVVEKEYVNTASKNITAEIATEMESANTANVKHGAKIAIVYVPMAIRKQNAVSVPLLPPR